MPGIGKMIKMFREKKEDFEADKESVDAEKCTFAVKYLGSQNANDRSDRKFMTNLYKDHKKKTTIKIRGKLSVCFEAVSFTKSHADEVKAIPHIQTWCLCDIEGIEEVGRNGLVLAVSRIQNNSYDFHCFKVTECTAKRVKLAINYAGSQAEVSNLEWTLNAITRKTERTQNSNEGEDVVDSLPVQCIPKSIVFPAYNMNKSFEKSSALRKEIALKLQNSVVHDSDIEDSTKEF